MFCEIVFGQMSPLLLIVFLRDCFCSLCSFGGYIVFFFKKKKVLLFICLGWFVCFLFGGFVLYGFRCFCLPLRGLYGPILVMFFMKQVFCSS